MFFKYMLHGKNKITLALLNYRTTKTDIKIEIRHIDNLYTYKYIHTMSSKETTTPSTNDVLKEIFEKVIKNIQ